MKGKSRRKETDRGRKRKWKVRILFKSRKEPHYTSEVEGRKKEKEGTFARKRMYSM